MMNCQQCENKSACEIIRKKRCVSGGFFPREKLVPNDVIDETTHMCPVATYSTSDHKEILDKDIRRGVVWCGVAW